MTELNDRGFLVNWTNKNNQIFGKRFNAAARPIGNEFVISTSFVAQRLDNDAAIGWHGRILVVWADAEADGGTNAREIYARLFDQDLNPLGPDFRVNTKIDTDQLDSRVVDIGDQGFLVVWESVVSSGGDSLWRWSKTQGLTGKYRRPLTAERRPLSARSQAHVSRTGDHRLRPPPRKPPLPPRGIEDR